MELMCREKKERKVGSKFNLLAFFISGQPTFQRAPLTVCRSLSCACAAKATKATQAQRASKQSADLLGPRSIWRHTFSQQCSANCPTQTSGNASKPEGRQRSASEGAPARLFGAAFRLSAIDFGSGVELARLELPVSVELAKCVGQFVAGKRPKWRSVWRGSISFP